MMPKSNNTKKKSNNKKANNNRKAAMGVPMAIVTKQKLGQPRWNGKPSFRVAHSELIEEAVAATTFQESLSWYRINPGNIVMFPWLSIIASAFEKYAFRKLEFRWVPHCAVTSSGVASMAVDYDSSDSVPGSRQDLLVKKTKATGAPYTPFVMRCDPVDLVKPFQQRYVLGASPIGDGPIFPLSTDSRMFDVGYMYFSAEAAAGVSVYGDLWVDYDVELYQPEPTPSGYNASMVSGHSLPNTCSKIDPLGQFVFTTIGYWFAGISKSNNATDSLLKVPKTAKHFHVDLTLSGVNVTGTTCRVVDASGYERKEWAEVTLEQHVGDASTAQQCRWKVTIYESDQDVFLAFACPGATSVGTAFSFWMWPW